MKENIKSIHDKLVFGIKDYLKKNSFTKAIIGLSGGIDSAVVACLAVKAIGKENVFCVLMPSHVSSKSSVDDAKKLAENLGIKYEIIPIKDIYDLFIKKLKLKNPDKTEENLQARIRAVILMSYSNKYGYIVLNTGNKSEALTGYFTLYGDSVGGLAVISDVYKTQIYELAQYINKTKKIIPDEIIRKEPSAELSPGQKDSDALPPYDILDPILEKLIDEKKSIEETVNLGFDKKTVEKVILLYKKSEFKRRQVPIGIRII